jgi:hypothetical protein
MSSPRAAMSVASRIACECDLKLITNSVYFFEFHIQSKDAPIEVLEALALFKLRVE